MALCGKQGAYGKKRGRGTNAGWELRGKKLTHVACADDQTLVAKPWLSIVRMLYILRKILPSPGLSLRSGTCQLQTGRVDFQRGNVASERGLLH
eukprot:3988570-Pyramimonas_sp.AAC.1